LINFAVRFDSRKRIFANLLAYSLTHDLGDHVTDETKSNSQ
jgi:hypothetical protein